VPMRSHKAVIRSVPVVATPLPDVVVGAARAHGTRVRVLGFRISSAALQRAVTQQVFAWVATLRGEGDEER
jgi:hypothetical protein